MGWKWPLFAVLSFPMSDRRAQELRQPKVLPEPLSARGSSRLWDRRAAGPAGCPAVCLRSVQRGEDKSRWHRSWKEREIPETCRAKGKRDRSFSTLEESCPCARQSADSAVSQPGWGSILS